MYSEVFYNFSYVFRGQVILLFSFLFYNLEYSSQRSVDTCILTISMRTHNTSTSHVYYDSRKALTWVGGPEKARISDYWGPYLRLDQLSYPQGFILLSFVVVVCVCFVVVFVIFTIYTNKIVEISSSLYQP
jgi:hypothetical protein